MEIITPGIRLAGDEAGDQKRVVTPREAFKNGATAIVMGRSITKGDIKNNIQKLIKSL
jgi:orotidine-5'-phosphate decarboxylase